MSMKSVGRYEIIKELGRGGMATVLLGHDPRFDRDVAIKILPPQFLHDPQFKIRFQREAKTIALLEHPSIVPVYDYGEDDNLLYLVMRYMPGGSLKDRMANGMSLKEKIGIVVRIATALDAAHSKGIIHRDLKPENILFDQYGNAFLSDFGIARMADSSTGLTGSAIIGTPAYMSPEQIQGEKTIDGRSDIYALGIILFEMLTGHPPYQADTPAALIIKHILDPIPRVLDEHPDLPTGFDDVITHSMAKDPDFRYATGNDFAEALQNAEQGKSESQYKQQTLISQGPGHIGPVGTPGHGGVIQKTQKKKLSLPLILGLVGVALSIAVIGFVVMNNNKKATIKPPTQIPTAFNNAGATLEVISIAESSPAISPAAIIALTHTPTTTETTTASPVPTSTSTSSPIPTSTITPMPTSGLVTLGGSDALALINNNDIWIVNLDGTDLRQLTTDGAEKTYLQWTPDGLSINYIEGKCLKSVEYESGKLDVITCFQVADYLEGFEISQDGESIAISLNRELFIIPSKLEALRSAQYRSDLLAIEGAINCTEESTKLTRWSRDGKLLSSVILGVGSGTIRSDIIRIMSRDRCGQQYNRLDEFPAERFKIKGYDSRPVIQNFSWDGDFLFAVNGFIRNDGYGDLYIYNSQTHKAQIINPIDGVCCYRDATWSPDGRYFIFAFQDYRLGQESVTEIYYVPYGTIGTGATFTPLPLPVGFFTDPRVKPNPVPRPITTPN